MNLDKIRTYLATAREDMDKMYEEIWVPTHAEGVLDVVGELLQEIERLDKAFDWSAQQNAKLLDKIAKLESENERLRLYPNAW